jgi:hypothetical protein
VGKSTFLKGLSKYQNFSFDDQGLASLAEKNPQGLLNINKFFKMAPKIIAVPALVMALSACGGKRGTLDLIQLDCPPNRLCI